jgi:WhiB family redox-sensing transcriptional regulator
VALPSNHRWTDTDPTWPERPARQARAACFSTSPNLFFSDTQGESSREALAVCAACPVRSECLAYALDNNEILGVWGGTTPKQRRRMQRRNAASPKIGARRAEVARLRAEGLSQADIAKQLGVGQATVSIDLEAIAQ